MQTTLDSGPYTGVVTDMQIVPNGFITLVLDTPFSDPFFAGQVFDVTF